MRRLPRFLPTTRKSVARSESEALEASALALLKRRRDAIAEAADEFSNAETQRLIDRIDTLSSLLDRFIVVHKLLEDTRIVSRVTMFLAMRTQTAEFTNRLADEVYASVRDRLRDQICTGRRRIFVTVPWTS